MVERRFGRGARRNRGRGVAPEDDGVDLASAAIGPDSRDPGAEVPDRDAETVNQACRCQYVTTNGICFSGRAAGAEPEAGL